MLVRLIQKGSYTPIDGSKPRYFNIGEEVDIDDDLALIRIKEGYVKRIGHHALEYYSKRCKGRPLILCGCGPSFTEEIAIWLMSKRRHFLSMGVNQSYRAIRKGGMFRPDFHLMADSGASDQFLKWSHELEKSNTQIFRHEGDKNLSQYKKAIPFRLFKTLGFNPHYKNRDMLAFHVGYNILSVALQLIDKLECNPIFLIGFDFEFAKNGSIHFYEKRSKRKNSEEEKRKRENQFACTNKYLKDYALPVLRAKQRIVINCSKGKGLTVFPRMPISEVINYFDKE